ncbi:MAG: hypothetical protein M9907_02935 [Burkholderiaceae bacterium]|nr:hypothetical protein [Burkholderiaceae bacterium]
MPQFKFHVTPEFDQALEALMRGRGLASKSEAIRYAVLKAAAHHLSAPRRDFSQLRGLIGRYAGASAKRPRPMTELERELDDGMDRALRRTRRA